MKARAQAMQDASDVLSDVVATLSKLTPREAAERAWHPGGPPLDELEQQIRAAGLCRTD